MDYLFMDNLKHLRYRLYFKYNMVAHVKLTSHKRLNPEIFSRFERGIWIHVFRFLDRRSSHWAISSQQGFFTQRQYKDNIFVTI